MCGRMNLSQSPLVHQLLRHFGLDPTGYPQQAQWNIAPSDTVPVVARINGGEATLLPMKWWLVPHWSKSDKPAFSTFNARSESAANSRAFARPLKTQRAIVPIHSFIEWQTERGNKQPWGILDEGHEQVSQGQALAGIWECWQGSLYSFAILTQAADADFQSIHDRMPIWLAEEHWDTWLNPDINGASLLPEVCTYRPALRLVPLDQSVNNSRNKEKPRQEPRLDKISLPTTVLRTNLESGN